MTFRFKMTPRIAINLFIGVTLVCIAATLGLAACGTAQGGAPYAINFTGPDGSTCYVVYDSGRAVGGNCK